MKINIRQKLLLFSLIILAAIGFIGYAVYESNKKLRDSEHWVRHTEEVISKSNEVLSLAKDIETASRGFVIIKDSSLLEPLFDAGKKIIDKTAQLHHLTEDNPSQQPRIDSLDLYIHKRLDFSRQMVVLRSTQGLVPAIAYTASGDGEHYSERLRQIANDIQQEENSLLQKRKNTNEESVTVFNRFLTGMYILMGVFTILLLIATGSYLLQNEEKQKRAIELAAINGELTFQNDEIEKQSSELIKYKHFFYNNLDLACFANLDGYFEEVNVNFTKVLGYSKKDLLDKRFFDFIHPDDIEPTQKIMKNLSLGFEAVNFINRFKAKTGNYKYLEWSSIVNIDTRKIYALARDVTDKIIDDKELVFQNEEKEKRAAELIIANKEFAFQNVEKEKRAAELIIANKELAFQNTEKEKRAAELAIANEELVFQNEEKEKRAAELVIANKELVFQDKEKETRAAELIIANKELTFQNAEKEKRAAELVIANKELVFQDKEKETRAAELIIANKELTFQNEEKEKRAAELVIANKELVFQDKEKETRAAELIIANKELTFQNGEKEKRAAELIIANEELTFQNEEKENRARELIIANKELAFQNTEKEKRAAELAIANKELAFQNTEKESRAAELVIANEELAFQNKEKEKRAAELIVVNSELTKAENDIRKLNEDLEQKVIQRTEQLESVNNELESFSYSVSHDLRAPLRAVHGYARMLKEDFGAQLDPEATRIMNNIMNSAKKMGQLIDDLLSFSRLGRKELVKMSIPMNDMVTNLCSEIKSENSQRNIAFKIEKLVSSKGDSVAIKQVWANLISNAVKYTKLNKNAVIEISSGVEKEEVIYSIKDNGAGFDMRYANKLFGVFQRLHTDDNFDGTGVGLAIVHRIISKHGGKVWADAKVNEGAAFYFSLPINTLS